MRISDWSADVCSSDLSGILLGLAMLVVFMVLAALYESWAIPLSVMMAVPLGMLGAVAMIAAKGMSNDVYFQVGMVTVIGLAAKNAILIVEFAKDKYEAGEDRSEEHTSELQSLICSSYTAFCL